MAPAAISESGSKMQISESQFQIADMRFEEARFERPFFGYKLLKFGFFYILNATIYEQNNYVLGLQ